jgi:glycosyltransferase involved in cell wall biosynthesis
VVAPSRAAVVHEWLTVPGGSEAVTMRILDVLGDADLFAAVYDPAKFPELAGKAVRTTFLDRLPGARKHYQRLLPIMTAAYERLDLSEYDLVVSSSHSCAKNVLTRPDAFHLCYCHTPMRHAWEPSKLDDEPIGRAAKVLLPPLLARLRREDYMGAARVDRFVANSRHVANRIRKYYRRTAAIVHPPVDVDPFLARPRVAGEAYLVAGRLVPYKRVDLAVQACSRLGRPLVVIGDGRDRDRLEAQTGSSVTFLGHVDFPTLVDQMSSCRALLFPGEEDFGIVPVEAQAAGAPVIGYGVGGVRDTVVDGSTGVLFGEQSVDALCEAIERFESTPLDPDVARENAARFRPERFDQELAAVIDEGPEDLAERGETEPLHA